MGHSTFYISATCILVVYVCRHLDMSRHVLLLVSVLFVALLNITLYLYFTMHSSQSAAISQRFYLDSAEEEQGTLDPTMAQKLPLQYKMNLKGIGHVHGSRNFSLKRSYLIQLGLHQLPQHYMVLNKSNVDNIVMVTGSSSNHFREATDTVAGAQALFPQYKIVFVDYGLTTLQALEVKSWCGVTLYKFDFNRYPPHVGNMWYYAWKILTMKEMLELHPGTGVMWLDSSVRFRHGDIGWALSLAVENGGLVHLASPALTLLALTHPRMYDYFPTDLTEAQGLAMVQAGAILVYNTRRVIEGVMYWAYLCALQKDCIAPTDQLLCQFDQRDWHREWVGCHRYDQSVFNLLEGNLHGFNTQAYYRSQMNPTIDIVRRPTSFYQLKRCSLHIDTLSLLEKASYFGNSLMVF